LRELSDGTGSFTARQIEKILRDGGVSKSVARSIVKHGFRPQNDVGPDPNALVERLHAATAILRGSDHAGSREGR
jgi:hypothetical protein